MPNKDTVRYLPTAVESVFEQTLDNLELICVDDGSTDGSREWLQECARHDERLVVIGVDPQRPGPGAARNRAMELAKGDFVAFLDSDDLYLPNALQRLVSLAEAEQAEIAIGGIHKFSDSGSKEKFLPCTYLELLPERIGGTVFSWHDIADVLFDLRFVCWNKVFRRSFLEEYAIRFPEGIFYEDLPFYLHTTLAASRMVLVEAEVVSNRRFRDGATTFTQGSRAFDSIRAMELSWTHLESLKDPDETVYKEQLLSDFQIFQFRRLLEYLHKNDEQHLHGFYEALKLAASALDETQVERMPDRLRYVRERVLSSSAVEFLAFDAWDARTTAARLAREKRALRSRNRRLKRRLESAASVDSSRRSPISCLAGRASRRLRVVLRSARRRLSERRTR